ncbi:hypothetical protein [Clostridium manihotivorum]|nr:hypothetical protein [Clostridium manihotivorum]
MRKRGIVMKFRVVYTDFWRDPVIMEEMTPEDRYFYLYLLTHYRLIFD